MSGVVIHLLIPFLVVSATNLFRPRQALLWLPMAVAADLDFIPDWISIWFFGGDFSFHRALGHTLLWPLAVGGVAWWLWRRDVAPLGLPLRDAWGAFSASKWGAPAALSSFYLFSHCLLDAFQGGAVLLWPLVNYYVYFRPIVWINTSTLEPSVTAEAETGAGAPTISPEYPWIVPEEVGLVLLAAAGWLLLLAHRRNFGFWGRTGPDAVGPISVAAKRRAARLASAPATEGTDAGGRASRARRGDASGGAHGPAAGGEGASSGGRGRGTRSSTSAGGRHPRSVTGRRSGSRRS